VTESRVNVVFDLGNVLLRWDPRFLYRQIFAGDDDRMEWFLGNICTNEWNIEQDKGRKDVPLKPLLCGGSSKCPSQSDGEVYRYVASVPGKSLALDIAGKGRKLAIDAPGAKITAPADPAAFKKFSVSCLNW